IGPRAPLPRNKRAPPSLRNHLALGRAVCEREWAERGSRPVRMRAMSLFGLGVRQSRRDARVRGKQREEAMAITKADGVSRRGVLKGAAAVTALSAVPTGWAIAQSRPLKVGLMLPYSGTYAKLGENITYAVE